MTKNENILQFDMEEQKILKISSENVLNFDVDLLEVTELRALVKSLTVKQNMLVHQNQEIEKWKSLLMEEKKEHKELNDFQSKEIEKLQTICFQLNKELKFYEEHKEKT